METTRKQIEDILDTIPDPEIGISIWQLGLVYAVEIHEEKKTVTVTMTLTSIGCPLFDQIAGPIREKVMALGGIEDVFIDLTFEPPWSTDKMSEEAKMQLGFM
jgi:metal-sulfur cluster biosynthetic enzyme